MGIGRDFKKRNSNFAEFEHGMISGVFSGMKSIIKDVFGKEKEVMRYTIDGKTFDSTSGSLAVQMDDIQVGEKIQIKRMGEGVETKYEVTKSSPTAQDISKLTEGVGSIPQDEVAWDDPEV